MLTTIIQCLLIILMIIQAFVLIQLSYTNFKRCKQDNIFWEKIYKELEESLKYNQNRLDEVITKEESKSEQNQ